MRLPILIFLVLLSGTLEAQSKNFTKLGKIDFDASVTSFEEEQATSKTVSSVLNAESEEIAALVLVKGFRYKIALIEKHFNENYAESRKFPKATLRDSIEGFSNEKLSKMPKMFELNGQLIFHGKTVDIVVPVSISFEKEKIKLDSNFTVNPADFDISIPKLILKKVANVDKVTVNFLLDPDTD